MTSPEEWWNRFYEVSNMGDGIRERIGLHVYVTLDVDYENLSTLRKELHSSLNDKDHVFDLIHYQPGLFWGQIIKRVKKRTEETTEAETLSKYNPLWGLPHQTMGRLMGEDVIVELKIHRDLQKQRLGKEVVQRMDDTIQQFNILNDIQTKGDGELGKIEKAEKRQEVTKDIRTISIEERLDDLEDNMRLVRGRQEERLEREKKELRNQSHNVIILKQTLEKVIRDKNLGSDTNQNLINEVTEIKQNQQERMSREAHTPNLGGKIERIEGELAVIKENQLKRLLFRNG